jgi:hypothetical protein
MPAANPTPPVKYVRPIHISGRFFLIGFLKARFAGWRWFERGRQVCAIEAGRRTMAVLILTIGMGMGFSRIAQCQPIDLSHQAIGALPEEFAFWRAGRIDLGHWAVVADSASPGGAAIQRMDKDRSVQAALAVYTPLSALNATMRTRFKLVDGSMPSAGVALRVTGPDDYYLVRASSFEQRVSLLHVVHGTAEEIAGVDDGISKEHWQTLEVLVRDSEFTISLDDRWVLTAFDRKGLTVGQFGIWTERDDVTRFDLIEITPLTNFEPSNWRARFGG